MSISKLPQFHWFHALPDPWGSIGHNIFDNIITYELFRTFFLAFLFSSLVHTPPRNHIVGGLSSAIQKNTIFHDNFQYCLYLLE